MRRISKYASADGDSSFRSIRPITYGKISGDNMRAHREREAGPHAVSVLRGNVSVWCRRNGVSVSTITHCTRTLLSATHFTGMYENVLRAAARRCAITATVALRRERADSPCWYHILTACTRRAEDVDTTVNASHSDSECLVSK